VDSNNTTQIKTTFIEQHCDAFLVIFKGISQDHYSLARRILEVCWNGIWSDAKLKRTLKVGLFNEVTIEHVCFFFGISFNVLYGLGGLCWAAMKAQTTPDVLFGP
jgi:hypothetical protein